MLSRKCGVWIGPLKEGFYRQRLGWGYFLSVKRMGKDRSHENAWWVAGTWMDQCWWVDASWVGLLGDEAREANWGWIKERPDFSLELFWNHVLGFSAMHFSKAEFIWKDRSQYYLSYLVIFGKTDQMRLATCRDIGKDDTCHSCGIFMFWKNPLTFRWSSVHFFNTWLCFCLQFLSYHTSSRPLKIKDVNNFRKFRNKGKSIPMHTAPPSIATTKKFDPYLKVGVLVVFNQYFPLK